MENLLSTSLKNIKKFIDVFCKLFDEFFDECSNNINKWKFIYDEPFSLFIKIIKNKNNHYSNHDYKIKFDKELIDCNLYIDFGDKRIEPFLWKIHNEIIFKSKAFLNEFKEKSPVAYEILLKYSGFFCKLDFESLRKYYLEEYKNKKNQLFENSVIYDFFQNKVSCYWSIKKRELCYEFFIESNFYFNFKNWICQHQANKNDKYEYFEDKSIESIIYVQKDLLENIIFGKCKNESFLFPKLRLLLDNIYQIKHKKNWNELKNLKRCGTNHVDDLFLNIIEKKEIFNSNEKKILLLPIQEKNNNFNFFCINKFLIFKEEFFYKILKKLMDYFSHYQFFKNNIFNPKNLEIDLGWGLYNQEYWSEEFYIEYLNRNSNNGSFFFLTDDKLDELIKFLTTLFLTKNFEIVPFLTSQYKSSFVFSEKLINKIKEENSPKKSKLLLKNIFSTSIKSENKIYNFYLLGSSVNLSNNVKILSDLIKTNNVLKSICNLEFFKNKENFYDKKIISFDKLLGFINEEDFKKILNRFLNEKFKKNCLDFVWSIELIKEANYKFVPLLLFSNDLISEESFWEILNLFDYGNY